MAKMIPSVISPEIKSNAERKIFEWFRDDPATADWIVLHSLGIANHNKVIHGETDFFVLAPYMGLFALEVKGGRVRRSDGIWSFTNKYGKVTTKERGPFDQAWDGVFSIIADLKKKLDDAHSYLSQVFYGIGVMFPDIEYTSAGCDEEQWQVFDSNDGNKVGRYIKNLFEGSKRRWKEVYGKDVPDWKLPTEADVRYIASLLRGDFDKTVAMSVQIRYTEEALIQLTNEQYRCIDQLDDNKRCLIRGGAGTGKTLIAIEEVKKAAAQGLRVGLFCYNKSLGSWFEKYFEDVPEELRPAFAGTFHKYMIGQIKKCGMKIAFPYGGDTGLYYLKDVPDAAKQAVIKLQEKFDKIVVDEAQDLINDNYLAVMNACLRGGMDRGRWSLFGDFSSQAIYNTDLTGKQMIDLLEDQFSFIKFRLTVNCRNTRNICNEISLVTGFEPPSDVWSKVDGSPVQYLEFATEEEELSKLREILAALADGNIKPQQITILSPVKREDSIVSQLEDFDVRDYRVYGSEKITFSTIQSFKGLENTVVILTDIRSISDKQLMYVALSRARSALYVLESREARAQYVDLRIRSLMHG